MNFFKISTEKKLTDAFYCHLLRFSNFQKDVLWIEKVMLHEWINVLFFHVFQLIQSLNPEYFHPSNFFKSFKMFLNINWFKTKRNKRFASLVIQFFQVSIIFYLSEILICNRSWTINKTEFWKVRITKNLVISIRCFFFTNFN